MTNVFINWFLSILWVPNARVSQEIKHEVIKLGQIISPNPKVNCGDKLVNFSAMLKKKWTVVMFTEVFFFQMALLAMKYIWCTI